MDVSSSSLPELVEIPEGCEDEELFDCIQATFESRGELPQIDINEDIAWILKVIIARGEDKAEILFHCGLIFLNPYVIVNANLLAQVMCYPSADAVTRRIKTWQPVQWDADEKVSVLNLYERGLDAKAWSVRQPPYDSSVFKTGAFRPMDQIPQRIPEINEIPVAKVKPSTVVNVPKMVERRFATKQLFERKQWQWEFNTDACEKSTI